MRCPNCGYENDEASFLCQQCNALLRPPARATEPPGTPPPVVPPTSASSAPIPLLPRAASRTRSQKVLWFIMGAVLGLIPAAIYAGGAAAYGMHGLSGNSLGTIAGPEWPTFGCYLIPVVFILMGIFLSIRRFRPLGYGLLAAAIISPVVVAVSCVAATKV